LGCRYFGLAHQQGIKITLDEKMESANIAPTRGDLLAGIHMRLDTGTGNNDTWPTQLKPS
jgi:hypothetical protein